MWRLLRFIISSESIAEPASARLMSPVPLRWTVAPLLVENFRNDKIAVHTLTGHAVTDVLVDGDDAQFCGRVGAQDGIDVGLVFTSGVSGAWSGWGGDDRASAHGEQAGRVVHEDPLGVLLGQALALQEGDETLQDVTEGQVVVRQALGHADRVGGQKDLVRVAVGDQVQHQDGTLLVGEVAGVVVQADVVDPDEGAPGGDGYYVRRLDYFTATSMSLEQKAWYLQDQWQVTDNFLLSLGIRNDQFTNANNVGDVYMDSKNQWAPRLGFSWDVMGDSTLKVFGNAGRYFLALPNNVAIRGASASTFTYEYFTYTGIAADGTPTGLTPIGAADGGPAPGPVSSNGETGSPPDVLAFAPSDLKNLYQDEYILGFEKQLTPDWMLGMKLTHRSLKSSVDDTCDPYTLMEANGLTPFGFRDGKFVAEGDIGMVEIAYGIDEPHRCKGYATEAANGLTEFARDRLAGSRLIGNPGCYPTAAILALTRSSHSATTLRHSSPLRPSASSAARNQQSFEPAPSIREGISWMFVTSRRPCSR